MSGRRFWWFQSGLANGGRNSGATVTSFPKRTVTCGELRATDEGREVVLNGWVDVVRDLGGLVFIDLRDRYGITQVALDPREVGDELVRVAQDTRPEHVIAVTGKVRRRPSETINKDRITGEIEVVVAAIQTLNVSKTPPFVIGDDANVSEELRFKYRYLDMRRPTLRDAMILRHRFFLELRKVFDREGYIEVETPMLTRMTPEGSREYLVPSRVHKGRVYALPQSPQVFKQLIMIGGMDKYFQLARCLRDEDLRADRQPEFTQLDLELSFGDEEDVIQIVETGVSEAIQSVMGREVSVPFPRITWQESMDRFGLDKPDLRFGLEIQDIGPTLKGCGFRVVDGVLESGGLVRALRIEGGAEKLSRKDIEKDLTDYVKEFGAKGLAWIKQDAAGTIAGPLSKFIDDERKAALAACCGFAAGDLLLVVADKATVVYRSLGELRNELARRLSLIAPDGALRFAWVVDFPMFSWDEDDQQFVASHHPFTTPREEYEGQLEKDPGNVLARAYDLVLNGWELGSGSVRIHNRDMQARIFRNLGISDEEAQSKFGFFLEAFEYGAPPHAGIALGMERLLALILGKPNIRDLVAFPKTASATCLMTNAPGEVPEQSLKDLGIQRIPEAKPAAAAGESSGG